MATHHLSYPRWYERIPSARDNETVQGYADWLCQIAWQIFATYTFIWPVSDAQADKVFTAYINRLERKLGAPIVFVRGDEKRWAGCGKPASARHYHVLLTSTAPLDAHRLEAVWFAVAGRGQRKLTESGYEWDSAKALPCRDPQERAAYCLKFIGQTDGDWKFGNLELAMPGVALADRSIDRADRQAGREAADRAFDAAPRPAHHPRLGLVTGPLPAPRLVRRREAAGPSATS